MITVTVCVGSSCHIKGAREMISQFEELMKSNGLENEIELRGSFCMERCAAGLNWQIGELPMTSTGVEDAVAEFRARVMEQLLQKGPEPGNE